MEKPILKVNGKNEIVFTNVPEKYTNLIRFSFYKDTIAVSNYDGKTKLLPFQTVLKLQNINGSIVFESEEISDYVRTVFQKDEVIFLTMSDQLYSSKQINV